MKSVLRAPLGLAAIALLSACSGGGGGGGVATTPPAPTPGPTPTPTPTPTPMPNTSLIAPLTSESFTNDAATGSVSYPTSGTSGTSTAAQSSLAVSYDASASSYTISLPGRSQTFRPSDRDPAASSSSADVFVRTSGTTTDSLTLLKPSTAGGPLAYRYVGAGFWQRTINGSANITGTFDAFTYGVKTPDAAVPRTGAASYRVDLIGVAAYDFEVRSVAGTGMMQVDFANGLINIQGTANELDTTTGMVRDPYKMFYSQFALASGANRFSGPFRYYSNTSRPNPFDGTIDGRFYGPAAEEVGGAFSVRDADGHSVVGTITGARGGTGTNLTLANLIYDQRFTVTSNAIAYSRAVDGSSYGSAFYGGDLAFNQRLAFAAGGTYTYSPNPARSTPSFGTADRNAAASDARYTVYEKSVDGETYRLTLYNPGPGNTLLALSYASFGTWERLYGPGGRTVDLQTFTWGIPTQSVEMPTSGTGTYVGVVRGVGLNATNGNFYTVGGTSRFTVNFGANNWNGQISATGVEQRSGTSVTFTPFDIIGNTGLIGLIGRDSAFNTRFRGFLAGPGAGELVGEFDFSVVDPLAPGSIVSISGATGAKRCPGSC